MSTAPNHLTALFVLSQRMVAAEWVDASSCYDLPHGLFPSSYSKTSFQLVSTREEICLELAKLTIERGGKREESMQHTAESAWRAVQCRAKPMGHS